MHKYSLLFLFFFRVVTLGAQEMKPMENSKLFIEKLKETSLKTNSITADFVEEKHASYLKEPQKSSGLFYYKKKNKLRWEKIKPLRYIFIVNEDKVRIHDNGKDVNVSEAKQVVGKIKELMLTLVNGEFNSGKGFTATYFENTDLYMVKLKPKNKKLATVYNYIQLTFVKETLLLKELHFYEKNGDENTMLFSNSKTNTEINDSIFSNF